MAKRRKRTSGLAHGTRAVNSAIPPAVLAFAIAVLLPFVGTFGASQQLEAVDAVGAFMGLAAVVAGYLLFRSRESIQPTRLTLALGAFIVWAFLALVVSTRPWTAFMGEATALTGWGAMVAMAAIGWASAIQHRPMVVLLSKVAPWFVVAQSALAAVQVLLGGVPAGTLPNSTYLGQALLLLLPFVLVPAEERRGADLKARIAIVLIAIGVLAASGSRVSAVLGLIWAVWTFSRLVAIPASARRWVGVGAVAIVAAGGLVFARAEVLGSAGVSTLGARPAMWRLAAAAIAERPFFGWGPDGFVAGGSRVMTPELAEQGVRLVLRFGTTDPHNLLVFLAVSVGIVGLGLFLWFAAEVALRWRRHLADGRLIGAAAWAVVLAFGVLLTAPAAPHILPLLAAVLGISLAPLARRASDASWQRPVALAATATMVIASAALGANALSRLPYESYGPDVSPAKARGVQAVSRLWPFDAHLAYLASLHLGYAVQADPGLAAQQPDLKAIQRAVDADRSNPFYALEHARTLGFYGAAPAAIESAFEETLSRYPGFPAARAEYGLFLAKQGRDAQAREQLDIAEKLNEGDEQVDQAIEAAEKALAE